MSRFRIMHHEVPGLNTASLPDLIFTVLFFFMIVTHIRDDQMKVEYNVPEGTHIEKLERKSAVTYIYIGRPSGREEAGEEQGMRIQINDKYVDLSDIPEFLNGERVRMSSAGTREITVNIKADRSVPMGLIEDVKQALRSSQAVNVVYSADEDGK